VGRFSTEQIFVLIREKGPGYSSRDRREDCFIGCRVFLRRHGAGDGEGVKTLPEHELKPEKVAHNTVTSQSETRHDFPDLTFDQGL